MGKPKLGRAQLLRMEADLEDGQDAFITLKAKRRKCQKCGRPVRLRNWTKKDRELEDRISDAAAKLREDRRTFRVAQGR